jgi:hypothetical protein
MARTSTTSKTATGGKTRPQMQYRIQTIAMKKLRLTVSKRKTEETPASKKSEYNG